jgi:hypothetical protein
MKIEALLIIILTAGTLLTACAGDNYVSFPAGTLFLEKPDITATPLRILSQPATFAVSDLQRKTFQDDIVSCDLIFFKINQDGKDYWLSPEWQMTDREPKITDLNRTWNMTLAALFTGIGLLLVAAFFRRKQADERVWLRGFGVLIFALILFHYAWLKVFFSMYPGVSQSITDEVEYFRIAACLMHWDFHEPFRYTLGYPLCCIPFMWLIGGDNLPAVSQAISYFSAMLMTPLSIVLAFLLIRKICGSDWKAFVALALWQVLPKIFIMEELPFQGSSFSPLGVYHFDYIFQVYQLCLTGFNSLSEWASVNLLLGSAVLVLYWRGGWWKYLTVGLLFGFAVLVRMNIVLLAPFLAYLFWITDRERLTDRRYLLKMAGLAIGGALAVFVWQLLVNYLQLGSPLRTPYALHQEYGQGKIGIQYFAGILVYYFKTQGFYLVPAVAGMLLTSDLRQRHLLILWTIPTVLFFCCFNFQGFHYRFFLAIYPGLLAGLVCSSIWTTGRVSQRVLLAGIMLFWTIPILPVEFNWSTYLHLGKMSGNEILHSPDLLKALAAPLVLGTAFYALRREYRLCLFLLLFLVLLHAGMQWLLASTLIGAVIWCGVEWGRELWTAFRRTGKEAAK